MVGNGEEVLDFVVVVLIFGQKPRQRDDEVFREFVAIVVDGLLFFGRQNFARWAATHRRLSRGRLLHRATPGTNEQFIHFI